MRRRAFLQTALKGALLCGSGGAFLGAMLKAKKQDRYSLRPPGAEDEERFLSLCIRCGLCVRDCPYHTLKLATLLDHARVGTPFFEARQVPCYLCPDIPCIKACPTDALDKKHLAKNQGVDSLKMGVAVVDPISCVAFWGIRCDVCYRVCPLIDRAIKLETKHNERTGKHAYMLPVVENDVCVGCGLCERACITKEPAIRVLPVAFVSGEVGNHYVKGWDTKDQERVKNAKPNTLNPKTDNPLDYLNKGL
ncbi:ferredoxin-type protein NapG [Helicobacter ailurogastricus]|uniref:Ferredoxin-type protein NapG (Periplasmic nitrate reductase) n=1 Tax=Helicobacter ailurogastricus TaxID=1578720 RepID=A0A0K2Y229_9HELI|nr:ferredoxin-type protein NapG [Helicobacter ailurogastricus]BDQ28487.1 ferredoxin-type protein NapG [Helicobacter ailurogastricus]CRF53018.1 Ferredoxin-type protein NapG (periplasmic nitrate reductase) [Helicobacter ailurogastricus]